MRSTSAEDTADCGPRGAQLLGAGDDGRKLFLDVAEVRELLRQLDHQLHRRHWAFVSHTTGRLEEHGPFSDLSQFPPILPQIVLRASRVRRTRDDGGGRELFSVSGIHEHLLRVFTLHSEAQR